MAYVALRGAALFKARHGRFATSKDLEELQKCVQELRDKLYPDLLNLDDKVMQEVARVEGAELISVSSLVGSIVAQ